ncbi:MULTISPECIES: bestrophin-like domain [Bradyrhizobium]|uniref:bestrophin-like domain n=1 Tax=Bradyrhizobium TaxID=374 RepID=UPI00048947B0|nr:MULTISPECIES: DUF4239 domain-containing protein [Bradyrhizobium]MCS3450583.1 hypothetical protein [Bradyrhizobium elkanii]MCS3558272.1 hypothetical protein [Bradyrhizobium elkanii]MCW2151881.1 hypothetical protein [Bradyrhizobium elkanii]MCW2358246.1 hypothetical protein [Bradyrhizobium elkanii]MCW2375612.1 hypothetical protein [Bradyrhizobium elkanii]
MVAFIVAVLIFVLLGGAALATMAIHARLADHHRSDETNTSVRLVATLFVTMPSLLLGLMMNSAANTYVAVDRNLHVFATDLILLDRGLRPLGPSADEPRKRLLAYVEQVLKDVPISRANEVSERLLDEVGTSLRELRFDDEQKVALWNDARSVYRQAVQQRWTFVEQSDGSFPSPLICILVGWLTLMFATLGFRAPRNAVVISTTIAAAALISAAIYLILEMSTPFSGPIQLSDRPLVRAVEEIRR